MSEHEVQVRRDSLLFAEVCDELLRRGHKVQFRVQGESMRPNLLDGDDVVVSPASAAEIQRGDVVLAENPDGLRVHRACARNAVGRETILRSDTGLDNDPPAARVFGKVVTRRRGLQEKSFGSFQTHFVHPMNSQFRRLSCAVVSRLRRLELLLLGTILTLLFCGTFAVPAAHAQTADLGVTSNTGAPDPVVPGSQITYTIVVINNGPNTATAPVFTTSTPANTTFVSIAKTAGGGTWNCVNPGVGTAGTSTCTRATNMGNGSTATFTYIVTVTAAATNGSRLMDSANITSTTTDPTPGNNTLTGSVTVQVPDLSMTQSAAPNPVSPGLNITYTETVTNNSTVAANNATLTQSTPANTTFVSATPPAGWTCGTLPAVGGTGTITCTANGTFAAGATTNNFTIVVAENATTAPGTSITNTATVSETGTDPVPGNNTTTTSVTAVTDLQLLQSALPTVVAPITNYSYSEIVTNNGPLPVTTGTITVSTQTPLHTTYQASAGPNWTCGTVPAVGGAGNIVCTYNAALASGAAANTLTLTMQVTAGTPSGTIIQNSATVADSAFTDPITSNNTSTTSIAVEPAGTADLQLKQTASPSTVAATTNYSYTELVTNNGPTAATTGTISVATQTPANTTYQAFVGTNWTCGTAPAVGGTGNIVCTYNAASAVGATANPLTITLQVNAGTAAGTIIQNSATVSNSVLTDPISSNNTSTISITVEAAGTADLQLTQTASSSVVAAGQLVTFTETVTNNGPTTAATGTITAYMQTPPNTSYQASGGTNWTCTTPTVGMAGPVVCTYNAALASGATASILTITFQVASGTAAGTTIQCSATVTNSTLVDPIPSNNTSINSIIVEPSSSSDLAVSIAVAPTPVFISSNFTYTITIQNLGQLSAPITSNVLTDTLPAGVTFVSYSASSTDPSSWTCSGTTTISCSITANPMALGATATISITVTSPSAPTTLSNTATVSLAGDPNTANNSATAYTVVQPLACATPGRDGTPGTALTNVVNTYYPPANTGPLTSGSTTVALGPAQGATANPIAAGDLVLIMQMQGASINSTNTSSYGDGSPGDPGSGSLNANNTSGLFEFVTATNFTGGTLTFTGTGPTGGLLNNYSEVAASAVGTTYVAQQTYQVIRVPQYASATLSSGLIPLAWNGTVGGVLAIDVASQLTLGGNVALDGMGFRGGAGRKLNGNGTGALTDYVTVATNLADGSKGEGIVGTPRYLAPATINTSAVPIDAYGGILTDSLASGSYARGAPGNAGGGGTDGDPVTNTENSGGGAGGNGGTGGQGGYGWNSMSATNSTDGGFGGVAFPASTSALVMGGGGGAGTTNDGSYVSGGVTATGGNGIFSSGGAGGSIAIIHAGSVVGSGTITSNGQGTQNTGQDSTGGGGAGGSILVFANSGGLSGLTVIANGGSAGSAWANTAPGGFPGQRHGPGGGGGGGVIYLTSTPGSFSVAGGINGNTDTVQDSYGSTLGQAGVLSIANIITETPGTQSGAYCGNADLAVTNSGSPAVVAPGGAITYAQSVVNNGPLDAVNAVFTESIPANTTFQSLTPAAGWTCSAPAVGGTGTISCTKPAVAASSTSPFTVVVNVGSGTTSGTQIVDVDGVTSGTTDPNLTNNSAIALTTVGAVITADLAVTNTPSAPTVNAGSIVTMTAVVTNNGPASATNAIFTEAIPANSTFNSLVPPAGWNCNPLPPVGGTGTITCTDPTVTSGATASLPVVLNIPSGTASGTIITAIANVSATTPDSNPSNNTATALTTVATAGQADLAVTASGTPNPVSQGLNISYVQTVTNNGPATETNATFTVTIPTNTTLVSFNPPATWTCNTILPGKTGTFTCTLNGGQTILSGASVNFPLAVNVNVATPAGTTIRDTPSVASTVGDPISANNSATVLTIVANPTQADVSIVKTASPEPVNQGTNLVYTLIAKNGGPAIAQSVSVTDVIPPEVMYVSSSTSQGTCTYTGATTTVSCSLGSVSVGSSVVITINVNANTFSASSISTNTATVSSTTSDPNPANNTSSATSTIQAPTAVDIAAFHAFKQPDGTVVLEWRTAEESRNLGFHLYREESAGRQRITPSPIAGSALLLRGSRPQHAAKLYRWIDSQPSSATSYWIEDLDINGTRTMHGPATVELAPPEQTASLAVSAPAQAAPLLRELHAAADTQKPAQHSLMMRRPIPPFPPPNGPRLSVADHNAVKIAVDHEGWYHISLADLIAAGLEPNTDTHTLRLFAEGVEQPLLITHSGNRSALHSEAIEFYGVGIDTPFSADRIYWLIRDFYPGKRILPEASSNSGNAPPNSFPFTVVRDDRFTYFAALLNGETNDNFFGAIVTADPVEQELEVAHLDSSSDLPVKIDLTLQGANDGQQHTINVQLNSSTIGQMDFVGQILASQTFNVEPSLLKEGSNTVKLTAVNGDNDVSVVQSIQLHYPHTYAADADWLRATAPSGASVRISGFTNPQVRVFDITEPSNISEISGRVSVDSGAYDVAFTIPDRSSAVRTILALSEAAISAPVSLAHHTPSFLDDPRTGADVVIISHPDFSAALAPLVQLRESQNHHVLLVTTDQVYDEYNFGERSPFAIRNFLKAAAVNWQIKPQYVLLVGDASFDPRNYLEQGDFDFTPTRMIETAAFKTSSDDWFTDFQSTGYATIPTGRLPVRTLAQTQLVVSKIVNYERGTDAGPWNAQALLVADQNLNANFSSAVESSAAQLPSSLQVTEILADGQNPATVHTQLLAALNNGSLLVNYEGHGAEQQWSFTDFFNGPDAAALTNGNRLPVYLLMDCLNGFFQDVYGESLAESVLLAPNGGGVAVWASSGFTEQAPQSSMNQTFLAQFAAHPNEPLGRIILQAKSGVTDNDVRRTWILFGDPAMKIHFLPTHSPVRAGNPTPNPVVPPRFYPICGPGTSCVKGRPQQ